MLNRFRASAGAALLLVMAACGPTAKGPPIPTVSASVRLVPAEGPGCFPTAGGMLNNAPQPKGACFELSPAALDPDIIMVPLAKVFMITWLSVDGKFLYVAPASPADSLNVSQLLKGKFLFKSYNQ
jgi:hypothetical protein